MIYRRRGYIHKQLSLALAGKIKRDTPTQTKHPSI